MSEFGQSVASFLREKANNMARWLNEEGMGYDMHLTQIPDLILVSFAQEINNKNKAAIYDRDFEALRDVPDELVEIIQFVKVRTALHDKFWRYLQLFSETVDE